NVSYDWTPIDSHRGTLSVRKECNFQSELTQQLSDVINEVLSKNKLLTSLVRYVELESRIPTPVLTGIVEGLRMPCRCWRYEQSDKGKAEQKEEDEEKDKEEEAWPDDPVQDFVLEVGMGDKTPILSALADSYIKRGTLCVITVKFERYQESDFAWLYSIYRRGKARRSPGQVTTYDMVCDADNVRVIINKEGVVEFPVGLTLFDFVPSRYLKENGVTRKKDKKAVVSLRMGPVALSATRAEVGCWGEGISISRYLGMLEKLL
ncbi:MAG: hypothetical protein L6R37_008446, partial [Teloschistes peruensis]